MADRKIFFGLSILAWTGFVVAAYFVVQKPLILQVAAHLLNLFWTFLIMLGLLTNALALGILTIKRIIPDAPEDASLLALACGVGFGGLGLLGFLLAMVGASSFLILLTVQLILIAWFSWKGVVKAAVSLVRSSFVQLCFSASKFPLWMRGFTLLAFTLTFLMTFLPPADAFDALLYHLTVPKLWLQDGGIELYNIPHYWFPGLVESMYIWGLGLGSEIVPQQIHFVYALCVSILMWHWTQRLWGDLVAGWALMFIISMPSILLLSSWAYTDLALIFFGLAMLYTLATGQEKNDTRWWSLSAVIAGMAMGVKYTGFVMPLAAMILVAAWKFRSKRDLFIEIVKFGSISAITASVWYLRNWVLMWNPIYPFLFGGRYWDNFRSIWFATPGTGSGWDLRALLLLPMTITLGYQDINVIDADIGPLLLLALPLAIWTLLRKRKAEAAEKISLTAIGLFTLFSTAFWTYGYITTRDLWQTRLLLPALIPFVIPMSISINSINVFDTKTLRFSFIVSTIAALSILVNLLDTSLTIIARNPFAILTGIVSSRSYFEKYQPGYADALQMVSQTPVNATIYSLFEPRSYGMPRSVQPDPILDNYSHDIYLYGSPEKIIQAWQQHGYTHVLLNKRSASFILENAKERAILDDTLKSLKTLFTSSDGNYQLLEIPGMGP